MIGFSRERRNDSLVSINMTLPVKTYALRRPEQQMESIKAQKGEEKGTALQKKFSPPLRKDNKEWRGDKKRRNTRS